MIAIFPEIVHLAITRDFEALSVAVRRYFAVGKPAQLKLDIEALVQDFGIPLRRETIDCPALIAGEDDRGRFEFYIVVSNSLNSLEARFAMAHLLGHFLIDIQPLLARGEFERSGLKEDVSPLVRYLSRLGGSEREMAADHFAASLILPQAMVLRAFEKLKEPKLVADLFGVSSALVTRRLEDLDRLTKPATPAASLEDNLASPTVNYKKVVEPYQSEKKPQSTRQKSDAPRGMEMIRDLARKIDKTMDR